MEMTGANFCPHCGAEAQGDSLFCSNCGRPIVGGSESSAPVPYLISPNRIIIMSLASFGLYLFYWLYKTWQHYRDHTGAAVYPVWHGLTLFLPIYSSFRAHAHFRAFGELASRAGLDLRFNPGLAFSVVLAGFILSIVAGGVSSIEVVEVIDPVTGEQAIDPETELGLTEIINPTRSELMTSLLMRIVSIVAGIWMVLHAQPRINYYWDHAYGSRLRGMGIGKGEIIVIIFGVLGWISTLSGVMSAS